MHPCLFALRSNENVGGEVSNPSSFHFTSTATQLNSDLTSVVVCLRSTQDTTPTELDTSSSHKSEQHPVDPGSRLPVFNWHDDVSDIIVGSTPTRGIKVIVGPLLFRTLDFGSGNYRPSVNTAGSCRSCSHILSLT
jgi:hypothetical protein